MVTSALQCWIKRVKQHTFKLIDLTKFCFCSGSCMARPAPVHTCLEQLHSNPITKNFIDVQTQKYSRVRPEMEKPSFKLGRKSVADITAGFPKEAPQSCYSFDSHSAADMWTVSRAGLTSLCCCVWYLMKTLSLPQQSVRGMFWGGVEGTSFEPIVSNLCCFFLDWDCWQTSLCCIWYLASCGVTSLFPFFFLCHTFPAVCER